MAAAREITPYICLRSGFAMIKKRSGDGAGPAMELEDKFRRGDKDIYACSSMLKIHVDFVYVLL